MSNKHKITLAEAKALTKKFRDHMPKAMEATSFKGQNTLFHHATIDRAAIEEIFKQPGCTELRVYLGMNGENKLTPVFVGVDEKGQEMVDGGAIMDRVKACPPICSDVAGRLQQD
ncbi:MAG: hypothetical protein LCH51_05075 [Bacteroidetes bacterium]|nr:hypothetical protein [Bacteroidota bacterium]